MRKIYKLKRNRVRKDTPKCHIKTTFETQMVFWGKNATTGKKNEDSCNK